MKKALLWLGPLACIALACLYAYAWFTRDPLLTAFDNIAEGMTLQEAKDVVGQPPFAENVPANLGGWYSDGEDLYDTAWRGDGYALCVTTQHGRIISKDICRKHKTLADNVLDWICNPTLSFPNSPPTYIPPPPPNPGVIASPRTEK